MTPVGQNFANLGSGPVDANCGRYGLPGTSGGRSGPALVKVGCDGHCTSGLYSHQFCWRPHWEQDLNLGPHPDQVDYAGSGRLALARAIRGAPVRALLSFSIRGEMVAAMCYPNPREVTANGVLELLTAAYEGWEPRSKVLQ